MNIWKWGKKGTGVEFGRNVFVNHPDRVFLGNNVKFGNDIELNNSSDSEVSIGDNSVIDSNTVINVNYSGRLLIGTNTKINKFNYISCNNAIRIGNDCMTAAFCHILDSNHGISKSEIMRNQKKTFLETVISDDVWIGTMCTVLAGANIGTGTVVGANSTARGELKPFSVYAGNPARHIKNRP
jgi:virginiamycin A acetyltransferase